MTDDNAGPQRPVSQSQLLAGLRVFDLSIVTAGAGGTQVLADHGAEVIKVEAPDRPDLFRGWTPNADGRGGDLYSPPFRTVNRNKKGFAADLKHPDGLATARKIIAKSDVVVENFRQGVMDRLGLGFEQLKQIRPDIVLVSMSSQGTTGPNVGYGSYGSTLDALGGTMSVTGYDADTPLWSSNKVNYPDQTAALLGPALIVFAVLAARATGQPHWIDVSQRELVTDLLGDEILTRSLGAPDPIPRANTGPVGFEWATRCAGQDQWLVVSVLDDDDRRRVAQVLGRPDLERANDSDLQEAVSQWSSKHTKSAAMQLLQLAGIGAAAVMKGYELHTDPYFQLVDFFAAVDLPEGDGTELQRGRVVRFEGCEPPDHRRAPHVGEHSVEILNDLLGLPAEEIGRLLTTRAVQQFTYGADSTSPAALRAT